MDDTQFRGSREDKVRRWVREGDHQFYGTSAADARHITSLNIHLAANVSLFSVFGNGTWRSMAELMELNLNREQVPQARQVKRRCTLRNQLRFVS